MLKENIYDNNFSCFFAVIIPIDHPWYYSQKIVNLTYPKVYK